MNHFIQFSFQYVKKIFYIFTIIHHYFLFAIFSISISQYSFSHTMDDDTDKET